MIAVQQAGKKRRRAGRWAMVMVGMRRWCASWVENRGGLAGADVQVPRLSAASAATVTFELASTSRGRAAEDHRGNSCRGE
jgi:hypothetical protein